MSDEDIAKLTVPELAELIARLAEEMAVRAMQEAGQSWTALDRA